MEFSKDILIIDFEAFFGGSEDDAEPFQVGAVLLDKKTLEEKESFSSFIQPDFSEVPKEWFIKKGYDPGLLTNAPAISVVANEFIDLFGKEYFISSWTTALDRALFKKLMASINISLIDFDYHVYDLWPVAYTHLLKRGYKGPWRSEAIFSEFDLPPRSTHDALEDCRYAAEVLRKIADQDLGAE